MRAVRADEQRLRIELIRFELLQCLAKLVSGDPLNECRGTQYTVSNRAIRDRIDHILQKLWHGQLSNGGDQKRAIGNKRCTLLFA